MVDREITFDMAALAAALPVVEKVVTLTCVSNPAGGDLISNATVDGLPGPGHPRRGRRAPRRRHGALEIDRRVHRRHSGGGADRRSRRPGGHHHERAAAAAEHGYPARLVVPGLYGYVSATKKGRRSPNSPGSTGRRVLDRAGLVGARSDQDRVPNRRAARRAEIDRGPVTFGGVAWAQNRGVRNVEVRIDSPAGSGVWQPADLGASYTGDTWRLWRFPWRATESGLHAPSPSGPPTTPAPSRPRTPRPRLPTAPRAGTRSNSRCGDAALSAVAAASADVGAERSRLAKIGRIADLLTQAADDADQIAVAVAWLSGELPNARSGGMGRASRAPAPADTPMLTVPGVDATP